MSISRPAFSFEQAFTQIPNAWLRDPRLTIRARGLLALLMTHKPGWIVTIESLVRENPEGRDAIRTAVNELKNLGYLTVVPRQEKGTGKLAGHDYILSEPEFSETALLENRRADNRTTGKPSTKKTIEKNTSVEENHESANPSRKPTQMLDRPTAKQISLLGDIHELTEGGIASPDLEHSWSTMSRVHASALIKAGWTEVERLRFRGELEGHAS